MPYLQGKKMIYALARPNCSFDYKEVKNITRKKQRALCERCHICLLVSALFSDTTNEQLCEAVVAAAALREALPQPSLPYNDVAPFPRTDFI